MLFSIEQAFVGREEIRAPQKMPAWEATPPQPGIYRVPPPPVFLCGILTGEITNKSLN